MKHKILIVEDEPDAGRALMEMLASSYELDWVETARDAVMRAHDQRPDLILVDIGLPDGNGLFLANMLGAVHDIPVVIMTGRPSFSLEEPLGANPQIKAVLFKPCSSRTLLKAVEEALAGGPVVSGNQP